MYQSACVNQKLGCISERSEFLLDFGTTTTTTTWREREILRISDHTIIWTLNMVLNSLVTIFQNMKRVYTL